MGKYRFDERLVEGIIKSRPNRFIMMVELDGSVVRCHCPSTGRIGGIVFEDIPCLLSRGLGEGRKTAYTVEAISLDHASGLKKSWIGINQTRANDYVGHFMGEGDLQGMVGQGDFIIKEKRVGDSRIDFLVGDTYVEVKTPLINLPSGGKTRGGDASVFNSFDRLIKHFNELGKIVGNGSRAVVILCYMFDAKPFKPPEVDDTNREIIEAAGKASSSGVENWQVNLRIDEEGVGLLKYFRLELFQPTHTNRGRK
ncbi:MAG: DNA/RNA nuclease SfsA [Candidatus Altiarchaeota archaeon]